MDYKNLQMAQDFKNFNQGCNVYDRKDGEL